MATLVLSTVGTALGGPVGGAIGALIGQSFDQQLLAPPSRGPRLGDLSVQNSSYGTQIPRIYGSMRVAGSVIWATDLVESEQTTGAKGQPDVTYSYSVSLAVALSSRPALSIGRIWADGKLLRGVEGDFKVPTTFRFYNGSQSQDIDPLIASVEGIANTPAYRGLAFVVFENLELAAFGNRIPFMTFEVVGDPTAPSVASILADASQGVIAPDATQTVIGYAAYGKSMATAAQPLLDCFDVSLFDDGSVLRPTGDLQPVALGADELGNSGSGDNQPKLQREQLPVRALPSTLRLTYYDPDRDYQTGEARASAGEQGTNEVQQDLPAVLSADDAKSLAQQVIARAWTRRDKLTLRLPPARIAIEPGTMIMPVLAPGAWTVEKCTIDGFVTVVELRPSWQPTAALVGEAGRIIGNTDIVEAPTSLALIDAPNALQPAGGEPTILIAASSPNPGWVARTLTLSSSAQSITVQGPVRKSILGSALIAVGNAEPFLIDDLNEVDVQLIDPEQWLTSCDDDALADGVNLAALGNELVQFGDVTPLGLGRFRLRRLLRGRAGTDWASGDHAAGEVFCLLDRSSVRELKLPVWMRGSTISASYRSGSASSLTFAAEGVRPLAPVNLSAVLTDTGDLNLIWTRRSRAGLVWIDDVDAPLGESEEQYRVMIIGSATELDLTTDETSVIVPASDVASLGTGAATLEVRQVGDWAASRPAQLTIQLP